MESCLLLTRESVMSEHRSLTLCEWRYGDTI